MANEKLLLGVVDYVMFSLLLLISVSIGVYFLFSGGKQKTTEEYLLAGKDMAILPVAFSLFASFLSAIAITGGAADVYLFGVQFVYLHIGTVIGILLASYFALPVYFGIQASTAYEYLDRRFGKVARTVTSLAFILQTILYMASVLYAPALALSAVSSLSIWTSVIAIGTACTFYCTLGGIKAVIWTDVFQSLLMFLGVILVCIKGFTDIGVTEVFSIAREGGRLDFPSFELDPTKRYTIWNILASGIVLTVTMFVGNQIQVQRLLTLKTLSLSRKALYWSIPMQVLFHVVNTLAGIVIYANYASCDPMSSPEQPISKADQILPFYMMTLDNFPGLPGICICSIFSGSLSTVSSAVNSLTSVTMQDLVQPFLVKKGVSESKVVLYTKAITLFYGCLSVALTYMVSKLGKNIIQASYSIFGMLGGPILSIFLLGMFSSRANETGVVIGLVSAVAISAWITLSSQAKSETLPVSIEGCPASNYTLPETPMLYFLEKTESSQKELNSTVADKITQDEIFILYKISFMWLTPIGLMLGLIIGYTVSIIINLVNWETKEVADELLSPLVRKFVKKKPKNTKENNINQNVHVELQTEKESPKIISDSILSEEERL